MNLTFSEARLDLDGGVWLCLKVNEPAPAREFILTKQEGVYDLTVKRHREKRSLDANAYYWKLCGDLAGALAEKPDTIYRRHVKDIGNYETLCIQEKALESFRRVWERGHLGRFIDTRESKLPGCVTVLAYYGSSDFSSAQMSRLIDNCIQDCRALGIETLPPNKLAAMNGEWDAPAD